MSPHHAGSGSVAVAGSRALPPSAAPLVAAVCRSLVACGHGLIVGCATGADRAVLAADLPVAAVRCCAIFGPGPGFVGSWHGSAAPAVGRFAASGGTVAWLAGGPLSVPLPVRLAARTRAVVAQASAGCVVFFASPASRGSRLAASLAAARGLPVFGFPLGFPGRLLPPLGAGAWSPFTAGSGVWAGAWVWSKAPDLF